MENKMYTKPQYKCGVCGTIFDSIAERANCEVKCLKKQEEEAKKAAEAKRKEEQTKRKAKIDKMVEDLANEVNAYTKDYGWYEYSGNNSKNVDWINKMWDYFFY